MELTRLDITKMLGIVYLESGQAISDIDLERRIDFWYAALSGYDREIVMEAFKNVALETNYPIKLANINNEIKRLQSLGEKTDEELWSELAATFQAVEHNADGYKYTAKDDSGKPEWQRCMEANQRIYDGLSPELKAYVRNVSELIEIARKDDEGRSIERAMFKKHIGQIREQERLRKQTPKEILELISNSTPQMTLTQGEHRRLSAKSDKYSEG